MLITQLDLNNKKVLLRVDFNVPMNKNLEVTDNTRIKSSIKPSYMLLKKGDLYFNFPHGKAKKRIRKNLSLKNIVGELQSLLNKKITFVNDCIGDNAKKACQGSKKGEIILLENLRFYSEEEPEKSALQNHYLLGDIYINDAFGTAHRNHASTGILRAFLKEKSNGFSAFKRSRSFR